MSEYHYVVSEHSYCNMQYICSGFWRGYGKQQNRYVDLSDRSILKEALGIAAYTEHRSIATIVSSGGIAIYISEKTENNNSGGGHDQAN